MADWKRLRIPKTNIVYETATAVLITMPHSSDYDGFKFWHSWKITENTGRSYNILYNENFTFKLFKNGKGQYNKREVIERLEIKSEELEEAFHKEEYADPWETHKPEELKPEKTNVLEDLKDE